MEREEILESFSQFVRENYYENLLKAVSENIGFLLVDFSQLDKFSPELASHLLENPEETIEACEEAIKQIDTGLAEAELRVRFVNLPEDRQIRIRNIRSQHLGKMIAVDGFVKRASEIRPEVFEIIYECMECGNRISMIQKERILKAPERCEACGSRRGFKPVKQKFDDVRWVVVEEPYEITTGERPSELMIYLKEDLTSPKMQNKTEPGNRIKVVGILKELPRRVKGTRSRQMEIYLEANSVESVETEWEELEISPEDEAKILELAKDPDIYNKLIASIAPALYGLEEIKEAISLQLFSGEPKVLKDKSRVRGDIHILLVGDPSTAKSALMKVVAGLIPRGRYVSGKGVTGAGLCTTYETLVQLEDGTLIPIGKLVEDELKNGFKKIKEGFVTSGSSRKILSLDKNLKIKPLKITKCWKLKAPKKLIKIITQTGKEILLTKDNPLPTLENGKLIWKPASKFSKGDFLATPRKLPSGTSKETSKNSLYLTGLIAGDDDISTNKGTLDIKLHNTNQRLLSEYSRSFTNELNITPSYEIYERPHLKFFSKKFGRLLEEFGIPYGKKAQNIFIGPKLSRLNNDHISIFLRALFDTKGKVIIKSGGRYIELTSASKKFIQGLQFILLRFGIISSVREIKGQDIFYKSSIIKSSKRWVLRISGLRNIKLFKEKIGFSNQFKKTILDKILAQGKKEHNKDVIPNLGNLVRKIIKSAGISGKTLKTYEVVYSNISRRKIKNLVKRLNSLNIKAPDLEILANSDVFWDKIKKIEVVVNKAHKYVYDVTVEGEHSFVANGLIIHNTATVVRDEEFFGGWILEAGALVMCNRSLITIDEFEKIEKTDLIALHEAMEGQTISIAKASIVATLPAQTAILGGGNPKLGRFDPYLPIKEQIDIPETILARFDLKFALRDIPNPEVDVKVADHILKARFFAEEEVKPAIDLDLLKKYIAYARKNCHPKLTPEAGEEIKKFYLELRAKSGEEAPIAITPRQYEALIRLAEASAKLQLRNFVTVEDAKRAIRLMKISLREFGFEPETGMFDIDRAEGQRITAAQRSKIRIMIDLLDELTTLHGKNIPQEEFLKRAKEEGVEDAEEILRKMISEGIVFQPKPGFIQKL